MAKAKVRGGNKTHRKKVESRNQIIKAEQSALQKLMNEGMKTQIEELKKKYQAESGATKNPE
jgi:biotin carboxylase